MVVLVFSVKKIAVQDAELPACHVVDNNQFAHAVIPHLGSMLQGESVGDSISLKMSNLGRGWRGSVNKNERGEAMEQNKKEKV